LSFHGEVLGQGKPGGCVEGYVVSPPSVALASSATPRC
jgi:hypothetical protein